MSAPVNPLNVLIVDDSALFRKILKSVIETDDRFLLVGTARNGQEALELAAQTHPDAMVLDVEMPILDGLETLKAARRQFPTIEIVMFSALTRAGAEITFQALEHGAFDFVAKPEAASFEAGLDMIHKDLIPKLTFLHTRKTIRAISQRNKAIKAAESTSLPSKTQLVRSVTTTGSNLPSKSPTGTNLPGKVPTGGHVPPRSPTGTGLLSKVPTGAIPPQRIAGERIKRRLVAIGVSTGGPKALSILMAGIPANLDAALLIVQHMPPVFTQTLAQRLNELSPFEVREAKEGDEVKSGLALIAPGGKHMTVVKSGRLTEPAIIRLNDDPPENNCRPSVDVLFRSVAQAYGAETVGVIMTGMGQDGTAGLRLMREKGAYVIAQNEASCTVFGMPKKPIEEGLTREVLPLSELANGIARAVSIYRS